MDEEDAIDIRTFSCIGSDGVAYELTLVAADGEESLRLPDGTRAVQISKGAYKAAGKPLYLWCNHPDAP
jgi:hypothetical protein